MSHRCLVLVLTAISVVALAPVSVAEAQSNASWTVPRTPDGQPDLQGVWDFRTLTPPSAAGGSRGPGGAERRGGRGDRSDDRPARGRG